MATGQQGTKFPQGGFGDIALGVDAAGNVQPLSIADQDLAGDGAAKTNQLLAVLIKETRELRRVICNATTQLFLDNPDSFQPGG